MFHDAVYVFFSPHFVEMLSRMTVQIQKHLNALHGRKPLVSSVLRTENARFSEHLFCFQQPQQKNKAN